MIVVVAGAADWPTTKRALRYFHFHNRITLLVGDNQLAKRWAMETSVRFDEMEPSKAIGRVQPQRVVAFAGDQAVVDRARSFGIRVFEVC